MFTLKELDDQYPEFILKFMLAEASNPINNHDGTDIEYDIDYAGYADAVVSKAVALYYAFRKEVEAFESFQED